METVLEPALPKPKKHKRINYALAATLVASGVSLPEAARQTGAKNATSLRVGLARRGVTQRSILNAEGNVARLTAVATRVVSQASDALRSKFTGLLDNAASNLCKIPVGANTKELKQLGEAAEPFVRMAKIVHDWGNDSPRGLIVVGETASAEAACGVDATTGSVPIEAEVVKTIQGT